MQYLVSSSGKLACCPSNTADHNLLFQVSANLSLPFSHKDLITKSAREPNLRSRKARSFRYVWPPLFQPFLKHRKRFGPTGKDLAALLVSLLSPWNVTLQHVGWMTKR